jgi:hypothetical protein
MHCTLKQRHFSDPREPLYKRKIVSWSASLGRFHPLMTTSAAIPLAVTWLTLLRDAGHSTALRFSQPVEKMAVGSRLASAPFTPGVICS